MTAMRNLSLTYSEKMWRACETQVPKVATKSTLGKNFNIILFDRQSIRRAIQILHTPWTFQIQFPRVDLLFKYMYIRLGYILAMGEQVVIILTCCRAPSYELLGVFKMPKPFQYVQVDAHRRH